MEKSFKINITPQKINFYLYLLIGIIIIIIISLVSLFLYKNFYEAITQSEEILILQGSVAIEAVNVEKFDEVMEKLEQKSEPRELKNVNSPFD